MLGVVVKASLLQVVLLKLVELIMRIKSGCVSTSCRIEPLMSGRSRTYRLLAVPICWREPEGN